MQYTVYAITDYRWDMSTMLHKVQQAVQGGIDVLQYRPKNLPMVHMIAQARALQHILVPAGVPLIINDFCDVAKVVDAAGVHLGQQDMHPISARRYLGQGKVIGLSVGTDDELKKLDVSVVDYVGIGPIYPTPSKTDAGNAIGISGFKTLRHKIPIPCVAIGGITPHNAQPVFDAGADGVAVISGLFDSSHIMDTATAFRPMTN